jgi:hypothetical protein
VQEPLPRTSSYPIKMARLCASLTSAATTCFCGGTRKHLPPAERCKAVGSVIEPNHLLT